MKPKRHKYGNASQVKCYSDGGKVGKRAKKGGKKKKQHALTNYSAGSSTKEKMDKLGLADGGKPKMKPPERVEVSSPILDAAKAKGYGPGGPQTPVAKGTYNPKPKRKR